MECHELDAERVAWNAVGVADAFRLCQLKDHDGEARRIELADRFGGWIGVVDRLVAAAMGMERFRLRVGVNAAWGEELPFAYDAWWVVADALWERMGEEAEEEIVELALRGLVEVEEGGGD